MIEINRVIFENEETKKLVTKEQVEKCLYDLYGLFGRKIMYILPSNRDYLHENEFFKLYFLLYALTDLKECIGFSDHIDEYANNFEATYFVTLIADILISHGLEVTLEPNITGHPKKPDIYAHQNGNGVFFECKNPVDPNLIPEQQAIFDSLSEFISQEYSLACFYEFGLKSEMLLRLREIFHSSLEQDPHIFENRVIIDDKDLKVKIIVSGVSDKIEKSSVIVISGLPVFNHSGFCFMNGINEYGKNIVFYKKASPNIVGNQIKKSRNKVPEFIPCVSVINISGPRFDPDFYTNSSTKLFDVEKDESISGVIFAQYNFSDKWNIVINLRFVPNPYAMNRIEWLGSIFNQTFTRQIIT